MSSSLASEIAALPRSERLALYARAVAYQQMVRGDDFVGRYRGDPLGFITGGLKELREDSWASWRTVLKAAYGQSLTPEELTFFREVAQRDPPRTRVKELWLIVGRRGGKDSVASMMTLQAAVYADEGVALRPGERIMVPLFATNKTQAGIVFRYMRGYFEKLPRLQSLLEGRLPDSFMSPIRLKNNVDIIVFANNFRAPRGYPIGASVFDECAFWRSDDSATPDVETYNAILPGTGTVPNSMIIGISSPYRQAGMLYKKWQDYFGPKGTDDVLVIKAPTATFNPAYDRSARERMEIEDPEAAAAEYDAEWRKDLADFVPREVVEACVVLGRYELPPSMGTQYMAFCDPSGGSSDSMTLAIGHLERTSDRLVLDLLREVRAPFGPEVVVDEFCGVLRQYKCYRVVGDHYAGEWPTEQFKKRGIQYEISDETKVDIYREALPLLTTGRAELLDNRRLIAQTASLERRTARGGRDTIDHPPGAHDDVANAALGVLVNLAQASTTGTVVSSDVLAHFAQRYGAPRRY